MRRLLTAGVVLGAGVLAGLPLPRVQAQASANEQAAVFEVASIKERTTPATGGSQGGPDRFSRTNTSLRELIRDAYQLLPYEIVGAPDWAGSLRFDVAAKATSIPSPEQMRRMVQQLLAQRFSLQAHTEIRELPMYLLHLAHSDGRLGPQLTRTTFDCAAIKAERSRKQEPAPRPTGPNDQPICTSFMRGRPTSSGLTLRFQSSGISTEELAAWLSPYVDRKIVDRTGLAGEFDLDLSFSPFPPSPSAPPPDEAVSTFTALQEQLGLKLESTKGPVEVLVIDHVEKPTPD